MNVDLDAMTEEMDPPSFKAARKKDRELLEKLEVTELGLCVCSYINLCSRHSVNS